MAGVNLDAFSDEQVDAMIAGCRALRARREPYVNPGAIASSTPDKADAENNAPAVEAASPQERDGVE